MALSHPIPAARHREGFTLVELLVVIGIIALLLGILLPSLTRARRLAQRTVCAAKLQQMMLAAHMHLQDHRGFFPCAGVMPGIEPQELDDKDSVKYDYFSYPFAGYKRMSAPITVSLATEMTAKQAQFVLSNPDVGNAETDDRGFIRNFICPSQASSTSDFIQLPLLYMCQASGGPIWYTEAESYIFNESVLGWADWKGGTFDYTVNRCKGQYNQIRQPSRTMFAADGLMGSIYNEARYPYQPFPVTSLMTLYNKVGVPPVTMWDAYLSDGLAGDTENFDLHRHDRKINIAFCDAHVETLDITSNGLSNVFLMAP